MMLGMVNVWAVLGAAVAAFAAGALWHGPLFGRQWIKMMGYTAKTMKSMRLTPGQSMSMGFVLQVLFAYVLARFFAMLGVSSLAAGLQVALWVWLFQLPLVIGGFLWENRTVKLCAFNAAYRLLELAVMTLVLLKLA